MARLYEEISYLYKTCRFQGIYAKEDAIFLA